MSKNGIRQIADFVNGMAFAGLLLQKNYRPSEDRRGFAPTFTQNVEAYTRHLSAPEYAGHRAEMMAHQIGVTDQSPTEMLVTAGLSAQDTITAICEEHNLSAQDVMELVTIVMALSIAASTPAEKMSMVLDGMIEGVAEKTRAWDEMIPSDEEMFGDEEDFDEGE